MADAAENPPPDKPTPPKPAGPTPMWMSAGGPAPVGKNKALLFGSLLIMLVLGALVGILFLPSPPVAAYLVSLPLPLYNDPSLPPVALAEQDTKLLVDCFPDNAENAYNAQELDPLRGKLKAIADGKLRADWGDDDRRKLEKGRPFVFHIVGHAAVADDRLFLLPIRADAADPQTWLPLDEILKAMEACPTPKKLLLLDLGRRRTNAFLGPLQDEATPKLHDYLSKKRGELPCPVLVSCSPGEESLAIPQAGASAFAFYVGEGVRGAADGYGTPDRDKKVKVRELAEFVKIRVARWARQNHDVPQVTKLFEPGGFGDFDLALDVPPAVTEDPDPHKSPFAKVGTADGWNQLAAMPPDALRRAGPHLTQWASSAVRAQQVYAATANDARTADAVRQAAEWWAEVAKAAKPPEALTYRSLASVPLPTPSGTPPTDPVPAIRGKLNLYARASLPESGTKVDDKDVMLRKADFEQAVGPLPGPVVARIVWTWLFEEYPQAKANAIDFASKVMTAALKDSPDVLFVEAVALKRATNLDAAPFDKVAGRETVVKFLRADAAASAALNRGSVGFEWVASLVAAAADAKLEAEKQLFAADTKVKMDAADARLNDAIARFDDVRDRLDALAAARTAVEDAARVLTGTAWAVAEYDWPPAKEWIDLKEKATKLADAVYRRPVADWSTGDLAAMTKDANDATVPILKRFSPAAVKSLVDQAGVARPSDVRSYVAILATALLTGPDRGKVWDAADQVAERLHLGTRKDGDLMENESKALTKAPTLPAPVPNGRDRRAEVAVGLLELAGHPAAAGLRTKLKGVVRAESAELWQGLAKDLRLAWSPETLKKRVKDLAAKNEWDALDRFARGWPVGAWQTNPDKPTVVDWRVAPGKRRGVEEAAYRAWVAAHYRKYATALTDQPQIAAAFQNAARLADR